MHVYKYNKTVSKTDVLWDQKHLCYLILEVTAKMLQAHPAYSVYLVFMTCTD